MKSLQIKDSTERSREAKKATWIGIIFEIILVVFKLIAGIIGHSAAMIADAIHSLSDLVTDFIVIISFHIVQKPKDKTHNYGHGKFETLSTILISIMIIIAAVGIFWGGASKIYDTLNGEVLRRPGWIAFIAALVSVIVKEVLYQYTHRIGKWIQSDAIIANAWHHRSDAFSSIAAALGIGGAIILGDSWRVLDPLAAVLVSFLILRVAILILKNSANELAEASLSEDANTEIIEIIKSVPGATNPHNLKTRKIGNNIAIDLHIKVNPSLNIVDAHHISTLAEQRLKEEYGEDTFVSIHIEPERI
ncbi:MAG: cation diffusion facilitator family transporter [Calditrichaceae bacterium]